MTGCVLRIKGEQLSVPHSLEIIRASDDAVNISVSEADGDEFDAQVADALDFFAANTQALEALVKQSGYQGGTLDFGVFREDRLATSYTFPPQLAQLAAQFQFELMVSVYAANT